MNKSVWNIDSEMRCTKMAVIDVGRRCQAKCSFCYYSYKTDHNDFFEKSLEQLNQEVLLAKERGCDRIDYTGGEPTIHPNILEHIQFCIKNKMIPRIITNSQIPDIIKELINIGCKDFLLSIHDIEEGFNQVLGLKNAWNNLLQTIKIIENNNAQFAVNTVITKQNYERLIHIVLKIGKQFHPYLYNLIYYNPQNDATIEQVKINMPKLKDVAPYIEGSIEFLTSKNIWCNIRYFPMCILQEQYRKHIVNHPQVMFDWRNEWDYGFYPKTNENYLISVKENFQLKLNSQSGKCTECNKLDVCGGLKNKYEECYGKEEIIPLKGISNYPFYYRKEMEEVDIIIPIYSINNNLSLLLEEILQKTAPPYNLILIHKHQSAAKNRNEGLQRSKSSFIIMLDNDICNLPFLWNKKLIDRLLYNPSFMAVSARLYNQDGNIGVNSANNYNISSEYEEVSMIPTACCIFRRIDIENMLFNEGFLGSGFEDTEFFYRMQKNLKFLALEHKIIIDNTIPTTHLNNELNASIWYNYNKQLFEDLIFNE